MQPSARARGRTAPPGLCVSTAVITALLSLLVVAVFSAATPVAVTPPTGTEHGDVVALALPASAAAAKTSRHEIPLLGRLWWRNCEKDATPAQTSFGKLFTVSTRIMSDPFKTALSSSNRHSEAALLKPFEQAHSSLVVDAIDVEVQLSPPQSPQQQLAPAAQAGALKRRFISKLSVVYATLKMSDHESPITAVSQASPVASLPSQDIGMREDYLQVPSTALQRLKAVTSNLVQMIRAVSGMTVSPSAAEGDRRAAIMSSGVGSGGLMRPLNNFAQDSVIYVNSTKGHIPMTIVGSSTTVVQFNGEAGNIIKAVVQLKDHRYDKSVKKDNCYGMYLRVELRNRYKFDGNAYRAKGLGRTSELDDVGESSNPDSPSKDEAGSTWSSFWDSFAPIFDNSAMCKVLQSVSMRVSEAPITEPYYVVLHSTVFPSFHSMPPYANASRPPHNDFDDPRYTCELDLFFEQESAVRLERLQFIFSLVLPLLVLFLPLPFTMWRADLVQQYMMESDFAEWMWMPPLLLRKKMIEALKAGMEWVTSLRPAYQQRVLRNQLLRQEQARRSTGVVQSATQQESQEQPEAQLFGWGAATSVAPSLETPHHPSFPAATGESAQAELLRRQTHHSRTHYPLRGAEANRSSSSSISAGMRSPRESIASDFDAPHDSAHHNHHCRHHTGGGGGSGAGAVTPPHSPCSCNALIEGANICSSSPGGTAGAHHRRRRARESRAASEASTAVSVHVPPLPDAAEHWREGNQRGRRARRNGHDLLFTTEEIAGAGLGLTTREQHNPVVGAQQTSVRNALQAVSKRPREEEEGMASTGDAVDGVPTSRASGTMRTGITASSDAAASTGGPAPVPNTTKTSPDEEEEEQFCRICREGSDVAPLITPCACTGSVRFVHATCLDRWRIESAKRNLANVNHCEICKEPFRVNIQRSMLLWESWQHILSGVCLFLTCFLMIVVATTLTHAIFGEMSCLASYHQVAYSTMFRFEGISLTLFVYCIMMLLVLLANLIVYSWFRSRPDVEEYVEEMHVIPPFYTRRNVLLVALVYSVLLAQAHATGYLLKYFLYKTSHLAWNWETSPLAGGILFSLFSTCTIAICSWVREMYMRHIANRGLGDAPATDIVVESIGDADRAEAGADNSNGTADPASLSRSITVPGTFALPASATGASSTEASPSLPPLPSAIGDAVSSPSPTSANRSENAVPQHPASQDPDYTQHFMIPPDQRVIRAFEYCPPRRKPPRG